MVDAPKTSDEVGKLVIPETVLIEGQESVRVTCGSSVTIVGHEMGDEVRVRGVC